MRLEQVRMNRFHSTSKLTGFSLILIATACLAGNARGSTSGDLWDISQGTVITTYSDVLPNFPIENLLGGTSGGVNYTIFGDSQPAGYIHSVEWRTPLPIRLTGFLLYANHDGPPFDANERGFSLFTLKARNPSTGVLESVYSYSPTNPYTYIGPEFLLHAANVPPTIAQEFRAEFTQFGDRTPPARGPRIVELDGFGTVVPEPAVLAGICLCAAVGFGFQRRHRRACGRNLCDRCF